MARQIRQVLMTYVTHYWVMAGIAAWLLLAVPAQLIAVTPKDIVPFITTIVPAPLLFLSPLLVLQVKSQFSHPRSVLTPHFRQPHIVVPAIMLVLLVVVYPSLIAWCSRLDPLGMVALASANAAGWVWVIHRARFWTIIVAVAVFCIQMTPAGAAWWVLEASSHRVMHGAILLAAAGLLAAWLVRVSHLREEMDDYLNPIQWSAARRSGLGLAGQRRCVAQGWYGNRWVSWYFDERRGDIVGYHQGNRRTIARLLKYGEAFPAELLGLFMTAALVIIIPLISKLPEVATGYDAALGYAQMAAILPAFGTELLAQRRPRLAVECLFPLSRAELIGGLFRAVFWSAAILWLIANAGFLPVIWLTVGDRFAIRPIAMMVVAISTCGFTFTCLGLRTAIWRSAMKRQIVDFAAILVLSPISIFTWFLPFRRYAELDRTSELPFAVAVAVVAVVGVVLLYDARRVWLKAELG